MVDGNKKPRPQIHEFVPTNMVTKRQLGIFLSAIAGLILLWIGVIDRIGMGEWGGFGPLQRIGLGGGLLLLAIGLILIRIGNRPA
jgi:hypothetical protein